MKVRICVVGMGRAGRIHASIFRDKVPEATLACVVDEVESVAKDAGTRLGVKWTADAKEAIQDDAVDAVVVSVPTYLHARVASVALDAGKHVLVEKPLAHVLKEAEQLARKTRSSGRVFQVGYMRRYDRAYREVKDSIANESLGLLLIYRAIAHDPAPPPGWAADPKLSGGIFYDMLSHDFDMGRYLMASEVLSVYATGSSKVCEDVAQKGDLDTVAVLMKFKSGAFGYVEGFRKSPYGYDLRTEVVGSGGSAVVGAMNDTSLTFADQKGVRQSGVKWFADRFSAAFVAEDNSFVRAIITHSDPEVSASDGVRAVEIAEACRLSVAKKKPVFLGELH